MVDADTYNNLKKIFQLPVLSSNPLLQKLPLEQWNKFCTKTHIYQH